MSFKKVVPAHSKIPVENSMVLMLFKGPAHICLVTYSEAGHGGSNESLDSLYIYVNFFILLGTQL